MWCREVEQQTGRSCSDRFRDAVELELLAARTTGVEIFTTHLAPMPQRGSLRRQQVRFIDETIAAWRDPQSPLPPILCGDFNAEPDSDEIRFLCGLTSIDGRDTWWQEAWRGTGRTDPGFTQDPANPYYRRFNMPPKRVDYVFVGDTWLVRDVATNEPPEANRGRIVAAQLAFDEQLTGVFASDHYGVTADIAWPGRPE
jgi:endonuclease/exonuclease/phosphatase family metal-dependent hydrolase